MDLEKKIALVTGGANGLGFAYAKELLRNGAAHVAILDLENSNGEKAANRLNVECGQGKAIFVICDVTNPNEFEAGFAKTVEEFGGLDIVINNAGIMNDSRWELMININYNAVVRGTLLGFQYMGKDKGGNGGVIVNIASVAGAAPMASFPIYSGLKHAVIGFSRSFGLPYHFKKSGVRVLTMCPGCTDTNMAATSAGLTLGILDPKSIADELSNYPTQGVDSVAQSMVFIIQSAQNGSVWVAEGEEPVYEISIPGRQAMKITS